MKCDCSRPAPSSAPDARQSLRARVATLGAELHAQYGPRIGWNQLVQILADRRCARYPCQIVFEAGPLQAGEFAHPVAQGERPGSAGGSDPDLRRAEPLAMPATAPGRAAHRRDCAAAPGIG